MNALPHVWAMPDLMFENQAEYNTKDSCTQHGVKDQQYRSTATNRPQDMVSLLGDESERFQEGRLQSRPEDLTGEKLQAGMVPTQNQIPRCWEHDCNGREFSTWSNLARHKRERSKDHIRSQCSICGMSFSRRVVLLNHIRKQTCKQNR